MHAEVKTRSLYPPLYSSKWNQGLNIKPETLKLLPENLQETRQDIGPKYLPE
jgi:hypothetical protein